MTTQMKPIRSFLFVPGNKESMLDKAAGAKADALILDLEDSVPPAEKLAARAGRPQDPRAHRPGPAHLGAREPHGAHL